MNRTFHSYLAGLFLSMFLIACSPIPQSETQEGNEAPKFSEHISEDYELYRAAEQEGLLILFPCYPCDAENTRTEFKILDAALHENITVLLLNFNQHLWLSHSERKEIAQLIINTLEEHAVDRSNAYIGGFSSGGNVSLLMADYLKASQSTLEVQGVFIADSPIDLWALYENAQETLAKDFSDVAIQEAHWIVDSFHAAFGEGDTAFTAFEKHSPYIAKNHSLKNLSNLKEVNIRLYSEPDTLWWRVNRQANYQNMNACYIEQLSLDLTKRYGSEQVEYIQTENRGYRANGDRHPHSWAIIDEQELVQWMLSE